VTLQTLSTAHQQCAMAGPTGVPLVVVDYRAACRPVPALACVASTLSSQLDAHVLWVTAALAAVKCHTSDLYSCVQATLRLTPIWFGASSGLLLL
jgi:hypothetical protein